MPARCAPSASRTTPRPRPLRSRPPAGAPGHHPARATRRCSSGPLRDGTLDQAMRAGLAVLAWSPLAGGRLAGTARPPACISPELVATLDGLAVRERVDRATIALAFVLALPFRPVPILGTQSVERLRSSTRRPVGAPRPDRLLPRAHPGGHHRRWCDSAAASEAGGHHGRGNVPAMSAELAWFGALCDDDYEQLGVARPGPGVELRALRSIVAAADRNGFDSILMPSGYALGIDTVAFTAACGPSTEHIRRSWRCAWGAVGAAAGPPAGHARPDAGRPAGRQHHLERAARRGRSPPSRATTAPWSTCGSAHAARGQHLRADGEFVAGEVDPPRVARSAAGCPRSTSAGSPRRPRGGGAGPPTCT
jgi:hypothetical protein